MAEGVGFDCVEVSDGTLADAAGAQARADRPAGARVPVLAEVGSKDAEAVFAPVPVGRADRGGARRRRLKVITEARERAPPASTGPGEVRAGLVDEIAHEVGIEDLIFEAPQRAQQAWFIRRLGAEVNLGNIPPEEVIPLETLRLGLRSDTMAGASCCSPARRSLLIDLHSHSSASDGALAPGDVVERAAARGIACWR